MSLDPYTVAYIEYRRQRRALRQRITRLQAHAVSSRQIGQPAEAMAFATKATELEQRCRRMRPPKYSAVMRPGGRP